MILNDLKLFSFSLMLQEIIIKIIDLQIQLFDLQINLFQLLS
jgi:hypothetical protein